MKLFRSSDGRIILLAMVKTIQEHKQYLGDVDGLIGDGDHGMNMNKGFSLYQEQLGDAETTLSQGLFTLGSILLNRIGGSMGPIYGTIFMEMSAKAEDVQRITLQQFSEMLDAGLEGLCQIVDARPGDKTLVDTLDPACRSLRASAASDRDFAQALDDMKAEARAGMESTKDLVAKYGRSARLGERSRGVLDAGAVSCFLLLSALADGIQQALTEE